MENYSLGHLVTENTKKGYMYSIVINDRELIQNLEKKLYSRKQNTFSKKKKDGKLYKKIYLHENPGKPCTDLWDDIHSISQGTELRKYPTAKPVKLLERLISISTDPDDFVYDPMCGSGTTGEACLNLKRKCILNDINHEVLNIIQSRFNS